MNWVTARLCWPPTIHSRSPPAPLVLAAVWLVLPWQRVAGMRLHVQRLVFSSQRATVSLKWRKAHGHERSRVDWGSGLCSSVSRSWGYLPPAPLSRGTVTDLTTLCDSSCFTEDLFGSFFVILFFPASDFFRERNWDFPSYYAHQWKPVAQWLAREMRSSPFMSATGRNRSSLNEGMSVEKMSWLCF